jgi:superfamily II DNA or RNA helicase
MDGYIYIRQHPAYNDACKLGKANNIPDRDSVYVTGESHERGIFGPVFKVPHPSTIERLLQYEFKQYNIKFGAGTEFYNKKIIPLIEPYLINLKCMYTKLSHEEIYKLTRCTRIKKIKIQSLLHALQITKVPRNYQTIIIEKAVIYFQEHDKGMLVLMCGVGKTLISLWIAKKLNSNKILIGVPSTLLLEQWKQVIKVLFPGVPCLTVSSGTDDITQFLQIHVKCFVLTTYASSHKVYETNFTFDMKINDEVHHLTTSDMTLVPNTKKYFNMLRIPCVKQLSLTATLKQLESVGTNTVSNDNIEYFGEIIDRKGLLWAIDEKIICDYMIQTVISDEEQLEQRFKYFHITEENDKRLFLSAFTSLKSISDGHSHHLLIYSNNRDNSVKLVQYIKMLLDDYFDLPEFSYSNYHSEMKPVEQQGIITNFKNAGFGIITCVYCLGEGWDFPLLDGVVFAENMSSTIRIVQSALRASRKNKNEPNKKTKIILPILIKDDWLDTENSDLKKVREVICQMGLEDETIMQKVKVFKIIVEKQKLKEKKNLELVEEFGEYDDELTNKLRLKTVRRTALTTTYEKARTIIRGKNINSKASYYELCDIDNRLSKEPEIIFKGQFTNWIEYLSIGRIYYELDICKIKVSEYMNQTPELKKHYLNLSIIVDELCKVDSLFPPSDLWVEYYNVRDLRDLIIIIPTNKKVGLI